MHVHEDTVSVPGSHPAFHRTASNKKLDESLGNETSTVDTKRYFCISFCIALFYLPVVKQECVIRNTSMKSSRNIWGLVSCWKSFSREAAAICVRVGQESAICSACTYTYVCKGSYGSSIL